MAVRTAFASHVSDSQEACCFFTVFRDEADAHAGGVHVFRCAPFLESPHATIYGSRPGVHGCLLFVTDYAHKISKEDMASLQLYPESGNDEFQSSVPQVRMSIPGLDRAQLDRNIAAVHAAEALTDAICRDDSKSFMSDQTGVTIGQMKHVIPVDRLRAVSGCYMPDEIVRGVSGQCVGCVAGPGLVMHDMNNTSLALGQDSDRQHPYYALVGDLIQDISKWETPASLAN
jgi:hypothetical protein